MAEDAFLTSEADIEMVQRDVRFQRGGPAPNPPLQLAVTMPDGKELVGR